jgi:hypothetical protein
MGRLPMGLRPAPTSLRVTAVTRRPAGTVLRRAPGPVEPGSGHLGRGQPESRRPNLVRLNLVRLSLVRLSPVQPGLARLSWGKVHAVPGTPALALLAPARMALTSPPPANPALHLAPGIPVTERRPAAAAPAAAGQHRPRRPSLVQHTLRRPNLGQPRISQRRICRTRISRHGNLQRGACPRGASPPSPGLARARRSPRPGRRPRQHR